MSGRTIKKNVLMNVIYTVTNMFFPLVTYPYVTRILSATGMGKISFFMALSNYAIMFGSLGISMYGIRAVARARGNKLELSQLVSELLILNIIITAIVIVILGISIPFVSKFCAEPTLLIINFLIVLITPLGLSWLYSGLEEYSYVAILNFVFKFVSLFLVYFLVKEKEDYPIYAALMAFSIIGSCLCNFMYSKRFFKFRISKELNFRRHVRPMLLLFASILAVSVYTNLDTIMLGFINGDDEVGYYSVASKVKWLLLSLVNAISAVLLPRLSNYLVNAEIDRYNRTLKKSISFIFLITIPLSIYFVLESTDTIRVLGGNGYDNAILCMQLLMPILIISGFSNIIGNQILIPSERDFCFMKAVAIGAIVDVFLNAILMPSLAAIGATIATLIAELVQMTIQLCYTKKEIAKVLDYKSIIKALLGGVFAGIIVLVVRDLYELNLIVKLIVTGLIYFSLYCLFLIFGKERIVLEIVHTLKFK